MECHDEVSRRIKAECNGAAPPMVGYEDIGEAAFGRLGRKIVSSVVYTELLGTCALLFILEVYRKDCRCQILYTEQGPLAPFYSCGNIYFQ